jgi:hypothetical protein
VLQTEIHLELTQYASERLEGNIQVDCSTCVSHGIKNGTLEPGAGGSQL